MISIPVDEGYAFDYLAILRLKSSKAPGDAGRRTAYVNCRRAMRAGLPPGMMRRILTSDLYRNLYDANVETFKAVDLAKTDSCKASLVDTLNYKRYLCKVAIQKEFFNTEVTETKIGYTGKDARISPIPQGVLT